MDAREIDRHLAGGVAAHARLVDHLDGLLADGSLPAAIGTPSLLPGWTVGHVLAHLARNADSHTRLIDGAVRGEVLEQYPGGVAARAAAIEADAARPAADHVADVRRSAQHLEAAWLRATQIGWDGRWRGPFSGELPLMDLAFRRWREVEIHHADLGLAGFGPDDWSGAYVTEELARRTMEWSARQPMGMTGLPATAHALPPAWRLAWLMGRATPDGLEPMRFG